MFNIAKGIMYGRIHRVQYFAQICVVAVVAVDASTASARSEDTAAILVYEKTPCLQIRPSNTLSV